MFQNASLQGVLQIKSLEHYFSILTFTYVPSSLRKCQAWEERVEGAWKPEPHIAAVKGGRSASFDEQRKETLCFAQINPLQGKEILPVTHSNSMLKMLREEPELLNDLIICLTIRVLPSAPQTNAKIKHVSIILALYGFILGFNVLL